MRRVRKTSRSAEVGNAVGAPHGSRPTRLSTIALPAEVDASGTFHGLSPRSLSGLFETSVRGH